MYNNYFSDSFPRQRIDDDNSTSKNILNRCVAIDRETESGLEHALSCLREAFPTYRHNEITNDSARLDV